MTAITFNIESFENGLAEGRDLAARDYEEMIPYRDFVPHAVDEAAYIAMEKAGVLRCYSARRDGKLIGYSIYIVLPGSLHAKGTKRANNTDWWLMPEERVGFVGINMLDFVEECLKAEGVVLMATSVMETSEAAQRVLGYRGHVLTEMTFTKVLSNA